MLTQFEAFIKCPKTGKLVSTGYVVANAVFDENEKPCGAFNCLSCNESHSWSHEDAQILEVHK